MNFVKKFGLAVAGFLGLAQCAMADITVGENGVITGSIDTTPVVTVAGIIITALGTLIVLKWVVSFVRHG